MHDQVRWKRIRASTPPKKFGPRSKNILTKNFLQTTIRKTVSCRVAWVWSERAKSRSRQIMILLTNTKTYATCWGPRAPCRPPSPPNLYRLPPPPPPSRQHCVQLHLCYVSTRTILAGLIKAKSSLLAIRFLLFG